MVHRGRHRVASRAAHHTKGGKRHHLLSSKGHRAPPFAKKGGRYSTLDDDQLHRPDDAGPISADRAFFPTSA